MAILSLSLRERDVGHGKLIEALLVGDGSDAEQPRATRRTARARGQAQAPYTAAAAERQWSARCNT